MKKARIIFSLILAVSVLALAACSGGGGTTPEGSGRAAPFSGSASAPVLPADLPAGPSGPGEYTKDVAAPKTTTGINQFVSETDNTVTFIDGLGNENTVKKYPQRVVIIKNCFLEMWYLVGGKAIARTDEIDYLPAEAMPLYDLGGFSQISAEAVLALNPDLVIMTAESSGGGANAVDMQQILKDSGVDYIACVANDYPLENTQNLLFLFSKVLGTEALYEETWSRIITAVNDTVAQYKKDSGEAPVFAVLGVYPSSSRIVSNANQVAEILTWLGGENMLNNNDLIRQGQTAIEFSIEELMARDPDVIFIQSYLSEDAVKEQVNSGIALLDGWQDLTAVKNNKVVYVPVGYALYRLNDRYPEAIQYFADLLYQ